MPSTRARFGEGPSFPDLEQRVNAALADREADPAVETIETITYRPSVTGTGVVLSALIVYRLAPPAAPAAAAVAEAEAIVQQEPA